MLGLNLKYSLKSHVFKKTFATPLIEKKKKICVGYKIHAARSRFSGSYKNKSHITPLTVQDEMQFGTFTGLENAVYLLTKLFVAFSPQDMEVS